MNEQKIIDGLNGLLTKNYDAERGYENAAEKTDNQVLAAYYRGKASNRYTYGHQIKDVLREMQGEIEKGTSVKGDIHNAWINFKNIFSTDKEELILEEIERGEEACIEEYNDFLNNPEVPHSVRRIITHQRDNVKRALRHAEQLEEQYG